jgi:HK97 family phage prohead protease
MSNNSELRRRKVEDLRGKQERRTVDGHLELRDAGSGKLAFSGWACVTDTPYDIGDPGRGGFVEEVASGAFRRSLLNLPDVVLNVQHGATLSGLPIARTRSGTLRLSEDDVGLRVQAPDLDLDDPDVQALRIKFGRGDLDGQMSFAFRVPPGGDRWSDDLMRRTIMTVELAGGDCSIVDFAANPATSSELVALVHAPGRPLGGLFAPASWTCNGSALTNGGGSLDSWGAADDISTKGRLDGDQRRSGY